MESIKKLRDRQPLIDNETPVTSQDTTPASFPSASRELAGGCCSSAASSSQHRGQTHISCPPQIGKSPLLAYGIDTLHASLRLEIPPETITKLDRAKKELQETSEDCQCIQFGETKLFSFSLSRSGVKNFPYVLTTGDVTLMISTRGPDSSIWNARLLVGSMSSNNGIDGLLSSLKKWLHLHGIKFLQLQVSRLDLFGDFEIPIAQTGIENQGHHVTRATTFHAYYEHRKLSGVQIGKSSIVCRIYDKKQEMATKRATEKQIFFIGEWGKNPEHVTRVEFQLRREAITELIKGVTDWESVKPALPGVYAYLVNWFRHTENSVESDRKKNIQHLAESSHFWKMVEQAKDSWIENFGKICEIIRDRLQKHVNIAPLVEQAAGCMLSVVAALGHVHDDIFQIFATCRDLIQEKIAENMEKPTYEKKYYARAALGRVTF